VEIDIQRLLRILPYKRPSLLLDRVVDLEPRKSARGLKCVTYAEPSFDGQTGSQPIFPNSAILESMSQLFAVLAYASEPFDNTQKVFYLLGLEGVKFRRPVVPGDRMELEVKLEQRRSNIWRGNATAMVDGNLCAQAEILAALTDREELPKP
jgi:3-hydroxyacyl-[acyl-carrier-protein] dehydratase